jgi:hypothetical protein
MKTRIQTHQLDLITEAGSRYKYRCKLCQQEWVKQPSSACPGVKVFTSRDPKICPQQYKSLAELEANGLQPKSVDQPIAAFRASHQRQWVLLYDEANAIPSHTKKKASTILYRRFYRFGELWRRQLGILATIIEWSIVATLAGFSTWSPSAPVVIFMYQHLIEALVIGGIVLLFSFMSLITPLLPKPQDGKKVGHTPRLVLPMVVSALGNTFFVILLAIVLIRPPWCPVFLCPGPKLILNPQGIHDTNLEVYYQTVQSTSYLLPGDPSRYTINNLPKNIGAQRIDITIPHPYQMVLGVHSLQQGRFGMIIEQVALVVRQATSIPYPLRVWVKDPLRVFQINPYGVTYIGGDAGTILPAIYVPIPMEHVQLVPGESDELSIEILSRRIVDLHFQVQVTYRVANEEQQHTLTLPNLFEVIFSDASNWHPYRLQDGHLVPTS